ncbi:MAG: hypothetical protein AAB460_02940 [Patescibacteria group bacterium]
MNVVFEEEKISPISPLPQGGFVGWLIRNNVVHTPAQGQLIAIILVIALFIAAITISVVGRNTDSVDTQKNFVPAVLGR